MQAVRNKRSATANIIFLIFFSSVSCRCLTWLVLEAVWQKDFYRSYGLTYSIGQDNYN